VSPAADVHVLTIRSAGTARDELSRALFAAGAGGIEERGQDLIVYAATKRELARLERAAKNVVPAARLHRSRLPAHAWQDPWIEHLRPERVSPGYVLVPVGATADVPAGTRALSFRPELVFGVGSHPTTQLAAEAVERWCRMHPGGRVLDVGTGTGVLAMIGACSGAKSALGLDVDRQAVRAARDNAKLNGLSSSCRFSNRELARVRRRFDLVVANVQAAILERLCADLLRVTRASGRLLVTGLLRERERELSRAFQAAGAVLRARRARGEWALLELQPQA
jgi:ribosomal protein L11 methyltransferase